MKVAPNEWPVCLKAAHPGYIDWEQFIANQKRLAQNSNSYAAGHMGVPRKGSALLQGIAVCGRCGRRMSLRYTGPNADYPVYCCRSDRDMAAGPLCQEVRALPVDAVVEQRLLDALAPDQIVLAMAALEQIDVEASRLERQWALRRERARYDAERARRQYDAVEPENRLVARTLELVWSKSSAPPKRSRRSMSSGAWRSPSSSATPTAPCCSPSAKTCRRSGEPPRPPPPTASRFCASSFVRSRSTRSARAARSRSGSSGKPGR